MLTVSITHQLGDFSLDAAFEAPAGISVLFGRSGSGKTSIINSISGIIHPDRARITLGDRVLIDTSRAINIPIHRRRIGYIFQEGRLFPHMDVAQNLAYGARHARGAAVVPEARIVEMLGLGAMLKRRPRDLSGGEKQRVAIGRALLAAPDLLLADEPLAALDGPRKAEILPYFERLRDELAVPVLYVSHAVGEVARLATSVIAIEDGSVVRQGPAEEVLADASVTPTGIRAAGAVLRARVVAHHADGLTELVAGGIPLHLPRIEQALGTELRVRISAQDIILSRQQPEGLSALNILPGQVRNVRAGQGPGAMVTLDTAAGPLLVRITQRSAASLNIAEGVSCFAIVKSVSIAPEDIG
ncbi:molybdenum ABC transporter ATP-binding protein [Pontivivens insulae]|uniref:Molybdenum import ATP-binding protein ModC n=1 Tax=Pontivivens insulae TaxID=1639689 RepID=A0A2R8AC01_9RHOB|nr:molybdenum ABC transporter ATP-binding protein [Pontivivens insulae]RED11239.1 molybdate transport system ATP-binding protein [Pontivivens insulae]SPF29588.1 Molybdenum import ATP-binding protein ModC [Pontivivens insulae]